MVDELVAENVLDHEHDRYGREGFKKTVADLHRTFPDLTLSIEEQTAEGDTVTTRCVLSGTDHGGVLWYPPTGRYTIFTGTYTDRFSDGRLVEHRGGSTWLVFWGNWGYRPTPARRKPSAKLHSQKFGKNVVKNRELAHLRDVPIRTRLLCCPRWEPGATCR